MNKRFITLLAAACCSVCMMAQDDYSVLQIEVNNADPILKNAIGTTITYSDDGYTMTLKDNNGQADYNLSSIGLITYRQHEHDYQLSGHSEDTHRLLCMSTLGLCKIPTMDVAHNYTDDINDDSKNYTCNVCEYVDEGKKAQFDARDYLSMTAVGGDVTIGFKKVGSPANYTIQVSEDGNLWSEPQKLNTETTLATIPQGATYYFRHGSATAIDKISSNQNNHWSFTMTGDGTIEADGNIISLIDATCQKETLAGSPQHVFTALFKGCERLTVAPALPFPATGEFNYMYMFEGTGISVAPQLPATTAVAGVYMGMFKDCKKLETVPILPATTVGRRGYEEMFYGCEKLKTLEIANITTVTSSADGSFTNWLTGTAADTDGKLIAPLDGICNTKIPTECIPSNWQWATKLKANQDPDSYDASFYTTFYDSRYAYTLSEGVKAYTATIAEEDGDKVVKLTAIEGDILPKDVAVLLHSNITGEMLMTVSEDNGNEPAMNLFRGVDVETEQFNPNYMLSYGQDGLAFYKMNPTMKLSANKAFLPASDPAMANVRAFRMVFEDEETGIENINDDDTLRYDNDNIYSVSGIRLNKFQKGINIVNGKKFIVK